MRNMADILNWDDFSPDRGGPQKPCALRRLGPPGGPARISPPNRTGVGQRRCHELEEQHESKRTRIQRPGHGRARPGHPGRRRIDRHHQEAVRRHQARDHRGEPPRVPGNAVHGARHRRAHQRRDPVRRDAAPEDPRRRAVSRSCSPSRASSRHQGRHGRQAARRLPRRDDHRRSRRAARAPRGVPQARRAFREVARRDRHRRRRYRRVSRSTPMHTRSPATPRCARKRASSRSSNPKC